MNKRRQAIENLEYLISGECCDSHMDYVDEIQMAITDMKICEANNAGWISVKGRMPPANDLVIVSINDDRGDNDYRYTDTGWYLTEGKCWIVDNEATINVEAWMPFPKPYKPPKEEA